MKYLFIILTAFVSSQTILAQKLSEKIFITPYVGINFSKTTDPPFYFLDIEPTEESTQYKVGWNIGVEGRYNVSNKVGVSLSAIYGVESSSFSNKKKEGHSAVVSFSRRHLCLKKISTPLRIHFYIYRQNLEVNIGIQPKIILSSSYSYKRSTTIENKENSIIEKENISNLCKNIELGIPIGAAYTYNSFVFAFEYNFGITKINKKGIEDFKQNNISVKFGYRIGL